MQLQALDPVFKQINTTIDNIRLDVNECVEMRLFR